ncbi:MAG: hypothetical protein NBKEAIPA_00516 [Nitrospirae bacterium]|nr:MAG: hypothetical protein UZ03_NOB001001382 [Nitrospira sp. OLB3]MBV6468644.1 hypothetical protein [Nitrospirota bacterium]MCE7963981.1 hypothetical protein [Nitrospira sp. NTP2]MCK6492829.1 hypothetical protein [Nitrospira sp.]MEB2337171.1 hypothetical protein [Nitrospirales bacterium]
MMNNQLVISTVTGPFREPREPVLSYDYSIQRATWAATHAVRVKIALAEELDYVKAKLVGNVTGSPGQQLLLNKLLSRKIGDQKLRIAEAEGFLQERGDVLLPPFTGPLAQYFPQLEAWVEAERDTLRAEIAATVGLAL